MRAKVVKKWLRAFDDDEEIECWIKVGDREFAHPNMATILRDEIFDYQDQLDDIDYVNDNDENMRNLFSLIDEILDELESRLQVNPELIEELNKIEEKLESGDDSDFVKVDLPEQGFWERAIDFREAKKIREYIDATDSILRYVKSKLPNLNIYIQGPYLYITGKNNASISTSIIADMLDINAKDIDDRQWEQSIYRIKL